MTASNSYDVSYWAPTQQAANDRVTDWPLALCDPKSVDRKRDFELGEIQCGSEITRTHFVYHNPAHRWYYLSNQHVTQAWLRVLWDSNNDLPQSKCLVSCNNSDSRLSGPIPDRYAGNHL